MDVDFFLVDPSDDLTNTSVGCNTAILLYKHGIYIQLLTNSGNKDSLENIKKIYSNLLRFQNLSGIPAVIVESYFDPYQAM